MDQTDMHVPHVDDLLDAYALGALEPEEVDRVERHLEICAGCQSMLEPSRRAADELLIAVTPVAVPPGLRDRMLARVHTEKMVDRAHTATPSEPHIGMMARLAHALFGHPTGEREDTTGVLLRELLTRPDYTIWPLEGTSHAPTASARLVMAPTRQEAVLLTLGLGIPEVGKVYQVWFLTGGRPLPNALFTVDSRGQASTIIHLPASLSTLDSLAVTVEPRDGSPSPTGPTVLAGATRG
jgi:anti-sigma-K factor RskA